MSRIATLPRGEVLEALPRLRRYAGVLVGRTDEADSLVAETIERARWQSPPEAASVPARTRLFALMRELHAGRAAGAEATPASVPMDAGAAGSRAAPSSELLRRFGELPTEEREVLLLVAVEGMRYQEVADLLHVPVSTLLARLKRARDAMRT